MNNMNKYFDQMWKKRCKKKKNEENDNVSKPFSSTENAECRVADTPIKPKRKKEKKRLEFLKFKRGQLDNCASNLSSQSSSISKQCDSTDTLSFEEHDIGTSQATQMELIDQTFDNTKVETLTFDYQNLQNNSKRIFVNLEDELIHTKDETFDIQKWIDKQIDSNSQLHSLDVHKKITIANEQFETYFNSKFNEKHSSMQNIVKGHLGNKIPYEKGKGMYTKPIEGFNTYLNDIDIEPKFEEPKSNDSGNILDFKINLLDELANKSNTNSDTSINEDVNRELYNYMSSSDDYSDVGDRISLHELQSLNKNFELEQLHLQNLCDLHPTEESDNIEIDTILCKDNDSVLNSREGCEAKDGKNVLGEIRDKLRFEKTLFYDSISSVQPYLQDNLEGPISHPGLKVESARVSKIQGISPCSSPEPNLINRSLKHQDFKRVIQRSRSLNKIVVDNKELNTSNGLKNLPKETQEFLEKMKAKYSLRLSKYQQIANEVTKMMSKENLESTYKVEKDLPETHVATTSMIHSHNKETNHHCLTPENKVPKENLRSPRNKKELCRNTCIATEASEIRKKATRKANDKILRNIKLGPDARYYKLTENEEELVEQILARPDPIDHVANEGCSNSSYATTGYDFDEDDAKRIAQINAELEHLELQYSDSCSISNKCDKEDEHQYVSNGGIIFPSRAISPQCEISSKIPSVSTKQGNNTTRTEKSSRHTCNKIQRDSMSTATKSSINTKMKHYLEEQRIRRQFQKRIEEIDRMLKELEIMELPKLSEKELQDLIMECKKEQGTLSTMSIESFVIHDSTSSIEDNFTLKNPIQDSKMSKEYQQIAVI